MVNEFTAKEVGRRPDQLVGLATVPLQDVDIAVRELSHAVQNLGLRGVVMGSNVNGFGFDESGNHHNGSTSGVWGCVGSLSDMAYTDPIGSVKAAVQDEKL